MLYGLQARLGSKNEPTAKPSQFLSTNIPKTV